MTALGADSPTPAPRVRVLVSSGRSLPLGRGTDSRCGGISAQNVAAPVRNIVMAYRNLTFRSLASDIRFETYLGEEHIVIPCIALVGDEVVYGMNAEGPEFIPAEELEFSALGWSGRPVLYDHPTESTSTANEPATLQAMSFGQIFYPKFEGGKLKVEAWCSKRRAKEIGQGDLIESIESGEVIELSVGAIISIEKKNGIAPNGKAYTAIWHDVQSDHLAIGLSGSRGACTIEMGCGANRVLKANGDTTDTRTMRANRGVDDMPEIRTATKPKPALPALDISPRTFGQRILSLASRAFRSLADDEGLSDKDLRSKLWDLLYAIEPAFYGVENVYQESMTVLYVTSPDRKQHLWRRTFAIGDDDAVTINDDREYIAVSDSIYVYMGENPTTTIAAQADSAKSCGCQTASVDQSVATNETDKPKEDTEMADDPNKSKTDATPPATATPAPVSAPVQPATEEAPKTTETPAPTTPATPAVPAVTGEQLKALLEEHPVVKHYRAQEAKERASLIAALVKKQTVLTQVQLEAKPIEELRTYAEFLGLGGQATVAAAGDFSGRMMADGADDDVEIKPVPNVWEEARKLRVQKKAGAAS